MYEKNLKKTKKQQENCTKVGKSAKKRRNQSGYAFFLEARSFVKKQEARGKKQEARGKKQEARSKRQEAREMLVNPPYEEPNSAFSCFLPLASCFFKKLLLLKKTLAS